MSESVSPGFRYDPKRNAWTKLPPMSRRRAGAAAAVLGGCLYVVGGTDGQMPLDSGTHPGPTGNSADLGTQYRIVRT